MNKKLTLAIALMLPSFACNESVIVNFVPGATVEITTNFSGPTGFKLSDHSDASVSVSVNNVVGGAQVKCRTGLKRLIESIAWQDCTSGKTLVVSENSPSAHQSGTFIVQAQVLNVSKAVVDSKSKEYYIHPSLNDVVECTGGESDASIYAKAGALLDQTSEFGSETVMDGPHYKIKLANKDRALEFISFRKKLVMNSSKTMMILRRKFVRPGTGVCTFYGKAAGAKSNYHTTLLPNGDLKMSVSYYQERNKDVWNARVPNVYSSVVDHAVHGGEAWFINLKNSIIAKGHVLASGLTSTRHSVTREGRDLCSAYVINARGSAVCIDSVSTTAYLIPEKLGAFSIMNGRMAGSKKSLVANSDAAITAGADQTLRKDLSGNASNFDVFYED